MRKLLLRLLLAAVTVAAALLLGQWFFAARPIPVQTVRVERGRVEATVTNSKAGTVEARRRAKLSPEIGGRVVELPKREGEVVQVGDVLVRLDDTVLQANLVLTEQSLRVREATHERACLLADRAQRELDRNQKLSREGHISDDLLDRLSHDHAAAVSSCTAASADIDYSRAAIEVARAELEKTVLRAPFAGVVAELTIEIGEWVTPSPPMVPVPAVVDVLDPHSLYIKSPMDEVDSAVILVGQEARVTLDPFPGLSPGGKVVRVAPYVLDVEAQNRTVEIEVELEDEELLGRLLPGTSADVEVILEARDDVLRIPSSCLIEGRRVLVVEGDILVEKEVEVGLRNWAHAEIVSGLSEGDSVVSTLDRKEVEAGARVTIEDSKDEGK